MTRRPEREVFELCFVEGLEPEEMATVTGETLENIRELINRLLEREVIP